MPTKSAGMKAYYPAYLYYGVRGVQKERGGGWRIDPRKNFMADALQKSKHRIGSILGSSFANALK